jgi:glycosyltransferase involved in cell wall biosynthesis
MMSWAKPSNDRVRVLHIGKFYPPVRGGMETHLQNLCRGLEPFVDVDVIVGNTNSRTAHERDGEIRVHRMGTVATVKSASICPSMMAAIRNSPADIVHLHSPNPTAVICYLTSGHPGKLIVSHHSDVVRQRLLRLVYEPWLRRLMRRADAIISFSPNYIESSKVLSRHRDKCHVIPHGIDPARFEKPNWQAVAEIKQRFGDRIVLAVGRLVYYKGFEYLIRAIAGTDAQLLIVGTGPLASDLRDLTMLLRLSSQVHFLGDVPDVTPYYHAARVFALPSMARSESFGIVQLEAMACGTPVINTKLESGVPFVSLDGISGLTVPPADVSSLGRAIERLMSDHDLHRQFSRAAQQRVRNMFTLEQMTARTLQLYAEVLQQRVPVAEREFAPAHD